MPSRVAEAARASLAGAATAGGPVLHQAQDAFVTGLSAALYGGAITAAVTAIAVAVLLRRHRGAADPDPYAAPADPTPGTAVATSVTPGQND